ncbi:MULTISPECIES: hypothetical protein [Shouchella]|uniref:Uncharacterized protein n=2 Tax=Shouchella TaxID=2893057 RepID=A0ABY7W459_9BACI|nr:MULTISPECIES: hypothetical protein [Shouchella]MED4129682.1 hypothetical protein [Shouchella miscanthi]WDF02261.1 hypothetical protein PQ477_12075 [Shouchella hunanensis]GAF20749.1 hypothetical protein JCM19047_403 [Bacillus sp. JCM 19047]
MHIEIMERYQLDRKKIEDDGIEYLTSLENKMDFEQVVLLVGTFFDEKEARKQMATYCMKVTDYACVKAAFEYTSLYNLEEEQGMLFERYQDDPLLKGHILVYDLARQSKKSKGKTSHIMEAARTLYGQVHDDSLKLKLDLILQYELLINDQHTVEKFYESMVMKLRNLDPSYVKTVLLTRLVHYYSRSLFMDSDDWEEAEKNCLANIVNPLAPPFFKGSAHQIAGYILAFSSKIECSLSHLWKAIHYYEVSENFDAAKRVTTTVIPFCLNLHKKQMPSKINFHEIDKVEQAHYFILHNERSKAVCLLQDIITSDSSHFKANLYWAFLKRDLSHLMRLACDYNRNAFELNLIKLFANRL